MVDDTQIAAGDTVGGRYLIEGIIDYGGMAVVYRARNTGTDRPCALKLIHPHLSSNPDVVRLFVKEAKVGAKIGDNPHITMVLDAGVDESSGRPFIAMELLDGENLEQMLTRGPVAPSLARTIIVQLADALDQAHQAGVVHRDLKPSNLFITTDRTGAPFLKVMDFGIAKALEAEVQKTATQVGTPAYAAPEQMGPTARKLAAKAGVTIATGVSPATDVWPIGLIGFQLLTGVSVDQYWAVETPAELPMKISLEDLESASSRAGDHAGLLPAGFDPWFARCMDKDAAQRFSSAKEALHALLQLVSPGSADTALAPLDQAPDRAPPPPLALQAVALTPVSLDPNAGQSAAPVPTPAAAPPVPTPAVAPVPSPPAPQPEVFAPPLARKPFPVGPVLGGLAALVAVVAIVFALSSRDSADAEEDELGSGTKRGKGESSAAPAEGAAGSATPAASEGMLSIPAGAFSIGCHQGRHGCEDDEGPTRRVTVGPFELARLEVSVADYRGCVDAGACNAHGLSSSPSETSAAAASYCNWGKAERDSHPINCVSWIQAKAYCEWKGQRLPTEEEWEYAARGTDSRPFPWGQGVPGRRPCWSRGGSGTCSVGSHGDDRSPFGVLDMGGNVHEWVASGQSDKHGTARTCDRRMIRGGSWLNSHANQLGAARRANAPPSYHNRATGFRCAAGEAPSPDALCGGS